MNGRTLNQGRFVVTDLIAGDRAQGMYRAVHRDTEAGDVFKICALLAWLATGRFPFGETTMEECTNHFRRPRARLEVPPTLADVVNAGVSADRTARPSLMDTIDALDGLLS